jgi:glutathione S-transferase
MRTLYHIGPSPFSLRARLALAHKGLDATLRDARHDVAHLLEGRRLSPLRTLPVLVDDDRVIRDSGAITHYLDAAYPERPRIWPTGPEAMYETLTITTAVDVAANILVDLGTRYFALKNDPSWREIVTERLLRAQGAIDLVAAKATRPLLVGDGWGAAEIYALSVTRWYEDMPGRVASTPPVAQTLALGFRFPDALVTWAKQHASRSDVRAVYG